MIWVDTNLSNHVEIIKFLQRSNICYQIIVKKRKTLSYREVAVANSYQFSISDLYFNQSIENTTILKLMISPVDHLPYKEGISTAYTSRQLYIDNGTAVADYNEYTSYHTTIEKKLLQSPYETQCKPYPDFGFHDRHHCIDDCISSKIWKAFRKVNILSPVTQVTDSLAFTLYRDHTHFVNKSSDE